MTAQQISIFQLGDMHFPGFAQARSQVDNHDTRDPGSIATTLALPLAHQVKERLVTAISGETNSIVTVCGDLTTKGDRDGFVAAVDFLEGIVTDPRVAGKITTERLHVVPGNHDVNFRGDQPFAGFHDVDRFELLRSICVPKVGDVFAVSFRHTLTLAGTGEALVMSVNSARGAGATRRSLAGVMNDELLDIAIDGDDEDVKARAESSPNSQEVLDVPLVHPDEINAIAATVQGGAIGALPVVIAHHGLLPQSTPRLNPYTEMANGGQVRRELQKLNRPVIYLHGHIHRDVLEVLRAPGAGTDTPGPPIVMLAAPELSKGFNQIIVRFDSLGNALGMKILRFRLRDGEQTVSLEPQVTHVALANRRVATGAERKVIVEIADRGIVSGQELIDWADSDANVTLTAETIEDFVESLFWQGLIRRAEAQERPFASTGYML